MQRSISPLLVVYRRVPRGGWTCLTRQRVKKKYMKKKVKKKRKDLYGQAII